MAEATEKTQGRMAAATEKTEKTMIQMVAEIRKLTGKNIGAKTIKDLKEQKVALDAQQTELENMRKGIEELGGVAEQDSNYNKMVVDYEKNKADLEKRNQRLTIRDRFNQFRESVKSGKVQERISKGIDGIKDGFKGFGKTLGDIKDSAVSGIKDVGTFGLALFLPALIAFLNSPIYNEAKKYILDEVLPSLTRFYNDYIVPLGKKLDEMGIGGKEIGIGAILTYLTVKMFPLIKTLSGAFIDLGAGIIKFAGKITGVLIKYGLKGGVKLAGILKDAIVALGTAIINMGKGVKKFAQKIDKKSKIAAGLTAISTSLTTVLAPGVAFLKGLFLGIATFIGGASAGTIGLIIVGVMAVLNGIFEGVGRFKERLEETGSIFEASKAAILGFIDGILTFPLDVLGYVAGLLGFDVIKAELLSFRPSEFFVEKFMEIFNGVGEFISNMYETIIKPYLDKFVDFLQPVIDFFQPLVDYLNVQFKKVKDFLQPAIDKFVEAFDVIRKVVDAIIGKIKAAVGGVTSVVKGVVGFFSRSDEERIADIDKSIAEKKATLENQTGAEADQTRRQIQSLEKTRAGIIGTPTEVSTDVTPRQQTSQQRTETITQGTMTDQAGGAPQVNIVNNSTDNRTNQQNVQSNSHPVMDNDPLLKSLVGVPI